MAAIIETAVDPNATAAIQVVGSEEGGLPMTAP
jgi:hypothetical protein